MEGDVRNGVSGPEGCRYQPGGRGPPEPRRQLKQTLDLTRQRFDAGVTDTVDVSNAQASVATADLDYINAVFAHNVAKLSLARAAGGTNESLPRFLKPQ